MITPIESYNVEGHEIFVKREDLACKSPGPPFAKVRGLEPVIKSLMSKSINTVGYMETAISMGGWGVAYFCKKFGMKSVIFMPKYSELRHNQKSQIKKWEEFGSEVVGIERPNHQKINFYVARKLLSENYDNAFMLPLGLSFQETVEAVSSQITNEDSKELFDGTIISCVGSGTMMSGVINGLSKLGRKTQCIGVQV
ncbi:MAG: hypothetical protein DRI61_15365, partial [Chloroflexi bacterium]